MFTTQFVTALMLLDSGHQASIQHYKYCSYLLEVKQLLTDMAVNISGMRYTTKVLKISRNPVTNNSKNFHRYGRCMKNFYLITAKQALFWPQMKIYKKISPAYAMATASPNEKPIFGRFCSTSINVMPSPLTDEAGLILTSKESKEFLFWY
ncbi:MAG: hypothetical protein V7K67_24275 [Nostoc sp.]